ncbi:unnamed protein product [Mortierella alpina]
MGKSAATRATRSTRQSSAAVEVVVPSQLDSSATLQDTRTLQQLRDELEELAEAKERADHRATQLEERAQYLEANARLSASMASKENMDLKEKARRLEIELSTVVDERDLLAQEVVGDSAVLDEARLMSSQLKEAWLRISTLRQAQEEHVQKLYKAQETNAKLVDNLTKANDATSAAKTALNDQKTRWQTEKAEFLAEIDSLKTKLVSSSKDGGKQVLDWEQDRTRLRDSLKNERAAWDKEKRGFLDQIASLKVKTTSLSLQKTAPPEWTLEKHQLVDQCTTLQSRVAALESDRSSTSGPSGPVVKKLELEKIKLEKKVDALKAKLVEVMDHFRTTQAQADEKKKPARRPAAPRKPASKTIADDVAMDTDTEEKTDAPSAPPPRRQRAKRATTTKPVRYHVDSTSDEDSEDGSEDDEDDDDDEDDNSESGEDEEMQDAVHNTKEGSGTEPVAGSPSKPSSTSASEITNSGVHGQEPAQEKGAPSGSPVRPNTKKSSTAKTHMSEEDSDSDFEPELIKNRGRGAVKRAASPAATEPSAKKVSASIANKKRPNPTEQVAAANVTSPVLSSAPMDSLASPNTPSEAAPGTPAETTITPKTAAEKDIPPASTTTATASAASTTAVAVSADKVKKKRKLLTGKGLQELGDILNGPGSELSSALGTGLHFGANKARSQGSGSSSLLKSTKPSQPKLQALDAIKMAFALPKARNSSPSGDMDS